MIKPLYNFKMKHFYEEFLLMSVISAFSALIAIRANENFLSEVNLCKTQQHKTIRCQLVQTTFYNNLELFIATFVSSFVAYTAIYMLTGYGHQKIKGLK
jgi:hypothetical protein